jgi:subtilisin-like proprotein convertase family protein
VQEISESTRLKVILKKEITMKKLFYSLIVLGTIFAAFFALSRSSGAQQKESGEQRISPEAGKQMGALAREKASRTAAQKKINSQLLYKIKMERGERIADGVDTLETGLTVDDKGYIEVDIVADVTKKLRKKLKAVKAKIIVSLPEYRSITASVPISAVESLAELDEVYFISPRQKAMTQKKSENRITKSPAFGIGDLLKSPSTFNFADRAANVRDFLTANLDGDSPNTGSVTSQGDVTHQANTFRTMTGFNGAGIKIGVMSDGVNTLAARQATGDLPPNVTVLAGQAGMGDEGTAMLELVHDIAPGAQLYFASGFNGLANFAQNVRALRAAGCTIIIDDIGYSNESVFQNGQAANVISPNNGGVVVQAVNDVTVGSMAGALYFSSAANSGNKTDGTSGTWEGDFVDGGVAGGILQGAGNLHNFGSSVVNPITQGGNNLISLQWSDPLGGSANDYDMFVINSAGTQVIAAGTDPQSGTQDPMEFIPGSANVTGNSIVITKFSGAARFLRLDSNRGRLGVSTQGSTKGHNAGINTISIAATPSGPAVDGPNGSIGPFPNPHSSVNQIEKFSSDGPRRIFYNADGTLITPGNVSSTGGQLLQKPDMTAADGSSTTTPGFIPFFGTSAAAPHAGALFALVKSACSTATNTQIYNAFAATAIDIEAAGVDRDSGAGIIMPIPALASLSSLCGGTPSSVQFSAAAYSVNEDGGTVAITVTRTGGTAALSVNYATSNGTATAGNDYQAANGTLNFAANENSKTFNITILDDTSTEGNETVNLTLSSPVGATIGTPATAVLNIIDNDVTCTYQLNPTSNSLAAAGGSGLFQVGTSAGCAWSTTVSAPFATDNGDAQSAPETVFTNSNPITINDRTANANPPGLGSLYPSNITVAGMSGTITQVKATVNGLSHTFPDDVDILLVGPGGQRTILMSDAGGDPDLSGVNVTFDQNAATLPDAGPITTTSYRPANYGGNTNIEPGGVDNFPAPAPGQTNYTADLSVFNGTVPNGTWQLFVVDDENVDTGSISGGWSLDITTGGGTGGWITITSGASGSGNGTVGYNVAANPGANSRVGTITVGGQVHTVSQAGTTTTTRRLFDFDGDGKADVSVFRPDNGAWYLLQSQNGFTGLQFGLSTDKLAPADYDGDGKTDVAVVRNGTWYLQRSQLGFTGIAFGDGNDIPVPADYDGDGKADLAVFRPSNGAWYLQRSQLGFTGIQFGQNGDKPVAADYDGDGKADIAVNRAGTWYILRSQLGFTGIAFGDGNDKLVPADYDGDGKADVAVFRPSNGVWYLQQSQAGFTGIAFGVGTDTPAAADYDGDGRTDLAVFRNGVWYLNRTTAGFTGIAFGAATDKPIPNAFVP